MNRLISISEASKQLGVSILTLRRWDKSGVLFAEKTPNGHHRYDLNKINPNLLHGTGNKDRKTLAQDVLEIITVFSARLYGSRSKKNKKLLETVKVVLE